MNRTICCIACHTDSQFKFDVLKINVEFLIEIADYLIIVNSENTTPFNIVEKLMDSNNNLINIKTLNFKQYKKLYCPSADSIVEILQYYFENGKRNGHFFVHRNEVLIQYMETENNLFLDHHKYSEFYKKFKPLISSSFDNIITTNDSFLIINSLIQFKNLFNPDSELTSFLISHEEKRHSTSFLRRYNKNGIKKWNSLYESKKPNIKTTRDLIIKMEISSLEIFDNSTTLYESSETIKNIHFDDNLMNRYLQNGYPIIKLKTLYTMRYDELPEDFNEEEYKNLHKDLSHLTNHNLKKHFLNHGIKEGRIYKQGKKFIPNNFDVEIYKELNSDLRGMSNHDATRHFLNHGIKEGRLYLDENRVYIPFYAFNYLENFEIIKRYDRELIHSFKKSKIFEKKGDKLVPSTKFTSIEGSEILLDFKKEQYEIEYPYLFHKKLLGINKGFVYNVKQTYARTKQNVCCIHCFKLSFFKSYFLKYKDILEDQFDIIITYVIEDDEFMENLTYIQGDNYGIDIGPRFIVTDYLKGNYDYIFYIHSKSNTKKREQYLKPFIDNLEKIKQLLTVNEIGGIFHSILYYGKYCFNSNLNYAKLENLWGRNACYMEEICSYLKLIPDYYLFSEGNFYILKKEANELLFGDKKLFSCLNDTQSFDFNWFINYYKENNGNIRDVYLKFLRQKMFGNNLATGLGWSGLADCMIEHTFERLTLIAVKTLNLNFEILGFSEKDNLKIQDGGLNFYNEQILLINTDNVLNLQEILADKLKIINKILIIFKSSPETISFSPNFDFVCINKQLSDSASLEYRNLHPDLENLNIDQLKEHYKTYGYKEGRFLGSIPEIKIYYSDSEKSDERLTQIIKHCDININNLIFY